MNLLSNSQARNMIIQTTAGSSDLVGAAVLDMQGYEGVMWIAVVDVVTAGGLVTLSHMHSDSTSTTDMVSCTGTVAQTTANTTEDDDKLLVLDVYKPLKRYVSAKLDKATQTAETRVIGIQYRNRFGPVDQSTEQYGVSDSAVYVSPTT